MTTVAAGWAPTDAQGVRASGWEVPKLRDPRIPFAVLLTSYGVLGFSLLGFNRTPWQMLAIVLSGCVLDVILGWAITGRKVVPLSAWITCASLALLLNYSHSSWLLLFPVYLAIGSKHLLTFQGRHIFNPSMFGVAVSLLLTEELVTAAPAYQWAGGALTMSAFLIAGALALFVTKIGRTWLIVSFLLLYSAQTALRAVLMRHHLPPETLFLGTISSPPFFLFTFYMITDPATSPKTPRGQVFLAVSLVLVDLYLHTLESVFTFFYAALICGSAKFLFLHARELVRVKGARIRSLFAPLELRRLAAVGGLGVTLVGGYATVLSPHIAVVDPGFRLVAIPPAQSGIHTEMSGILGEVDPRVAHLAKWILTIGDAVATGDADGDGRMDLFLTNSLKRPEDRAALYLNRGDFKFERFAIPSLTTRFAEPKKNGGVGGAAFVDYDGDGDEDLLVTVGFGSSRLMRNRLVEDGALSYEDVTAAAGLEDHSVSLAGLFFDFDRDAKLDLLIANALTVNLPGYDRPTPLNFFDLPKPEYEGDRRMFAFMHNGWHNADNGGLNALWRARGDGTFEKQDMTALGMPETHWSISVATGDLNRDGWTDLYLATDFGRDDLYLNEGGKHFRRVAGPMFGDVGKDTYKGMNSTIADFDRNGWLDVYVSDNHHALQAEGSLLWMTRANPKDAFVPSFSDEATRRGALNERRWGWGASAGDLDNDGWLDLIQANGMVDDRLDPMGYKRKDYLYVNHKLMQSGPEIHTYADKWGDIRGRTIFPNEKRRALRNLGDGNFVDVADVVGAADPDNSRGVALVDLDDDGDLDVVVTNQHGPVSLYRNSLPAFNYTSSSAPTPPPGKGLREFLSPSPHKGTFEKHTAHPWIGIRLIGDGKTTHRTALGSRISVHFGAHEEQMQEVGLLAGFSGQNDPRLHFGLGPHTGPVEVTIEWYGGGKQTLELEPNRYHEVRQ